MTDDTATYLHVKIQLVRGKHRVFEAAMADTDPFSRRTGGDLWAHSHLMIGTARPCTTYGGSGRRTACSTPSRRFGPSHPDARRWHDAFAEVDRGRGIGTSASHQLLALAVSRTPQRYRPTTA